MINRAKLEEAIAFFRDDCRFTDKGNALRDVVLAAAEAHLATLPKTKMVEVWRVEWAYAAHVGWAVEARHFPTEAEARTAASHRAGNGCRCIRVTGPHMQEIPA
jgi:hypothetical protein